MKKRDWQYWYYPLLFLQVVVWQLWQRQDGHRRMEMGLL